MNNGDGNLIVILHIDTYARLAAVGADE